jgi:carbon-monoxide dehydrogenase medium subunit
MFPDQFDYHRASSVAEARELMREFSDDEVELLAGGHSLIPTMKSGLASPDILIDISQIDELSGITTEEDRISVGAVTRYADMLESDDLREAAPSFYEAVEHVGDRQVRNRGTVGGNLAHADPAADLPGAALAADASVTVVGDDGSRTIPGDDLFLGMYMTDVGPEEILTEVTFPRVDADVRGAYAKKASPSSGYAMVGVAVRLEVHDDEIQRARVGASGVLDHGVRLEPVEDLLTGQPLTPDLAGSAGEAALDDIDESLLLSDAQASAEFRGALLETYTERAVAAALSE